MANAGFLTRPIHFVPRDPVPSQSTLVQFLRQPAHLDVLKPLAKSPFPLQQDTAAAGQLSPSGYRHAFDRTKTRVGRVWPLTPPGLFSALRAIKPKHVMTPEQAAVDNAKQDAWKLVLSPLAGFFTGNVGTSVLGLPVGLAAAAAFLTGALIYRQLNGKKFWRGPVEQFETRSSRRITNPYATYVSGRRQIVIHEQGSYPLADTALVGGILEYLKQASNKSIRANWGKLPLDRAIEFSVLLELAEKNAQQPLGPGEQAYLDARFHAPIRRVVEAIEKGGLQVYSERLPAQSVTLGDQTGLSLADLQLAALMLAERNHGPKVFRQALRGKYSSLLPS